MTIFVYYEPAIRTELAGPISERLEETAVFACGPCSAPFDSFDFQIKGKTRISYFSLIFRSIKSDANLNLLGSSKRKSNRVFLFAQTKVHHTCLSAERRVARIANRI